MVQGTPENTPIVHFYTAWAEPGRPRQPSRLPGLKKH